MPPTDLTLELTQKLRILWRMFIARINHRSIEICDPSIAFRVARHAPIAAWGERDGSDLGTIGHAASFELSREESADECFEGFADFPSCVLAVEGCMRGEQEDLLGGCSTADEMIQEEIVQLVRSDRPFGFLLDRLIA